MHIAPDIRQQSLEEAFANLNRARVSRMVLASQYKQSSVDKAKGIHTKVSKSYKRQMELFDNTIAKIEELITKAKGYQEKATLLHNELVNVETHLDEHGEPLF